MAKVLLADQIAQLDLALLNQKVSGETYEMIAERLGMGVRTIARRKDLLVTRGSLSSFKTEPEPEVQPRRRKASQRAPDTLESILKEASTATIAGPDESMKILSTILRSDDVSPHYRAMASKHLNELRTQHAPKDSLGPPAPLTREDKIDRLASLMDCVGHDVTQAAMEKQWPPSSSPSPSLEAATQSPSSSTSSGTGDPCSSSGPDASSPSSSPTEPPGPTDTPPSGAGDPT